MKVMLYQHPRPVRRYVRHAYRIWRGVESRKAARVRLELELGLVQLYDTCRRCDGGAHAFTDPNGYVVSIPAEWGLR